MMDLAPNMADIGRHLYQLFSPGFVQAYPDAWIEIATGHPDIRDGALDDAQCWGVFEIAKAATFAAARNADGYNVYIAPALRHGKQPRTGRAKDDSVLTAAYGWTEYDEAGDDARVAAILTDRQLKPAIAVTTGTAPHVRRHLYFKIAGNPTPQELLAVNTALMKLLGTDAVQNPSRVMRLAGTISYPSAKKQTRGYVAELTTLRVNAEARAYTVKELVGLVPVAQPQDSNPFTEYGEERGNKGQQGRTDEEIKKLLEDSHTDHWHNNLRDATASMLGRGWSDFQIRLACAVFCRDGFSDSDLDKLIDDARVKWNKANPSDTDDEPVSPVGRRIFYAGEDDETIEKRPLLKGFLNKGEISSLIGPPKSMKSALMTEIAIHVAAGMEWRGHRSKEACGVVIFALERGDQYRRRLRAYLKRLGLDHLPVAVVPGIVNLLDRKGLQTIIADVKEAEEHWGCSVGLAIIDTFSKAIAAGGGDEDKAMFQNRAAANLRRVFESLDLHIATVGHVGKDESRGERGSNARLGDVDVLIQISISGDARIVKVVSANDQAERTLATFRSEVVEVGVDDDGDTVTEWIVSAAEVEAPSPATTGTAKAKLSASERRALDMLVRCINDRGQPAPTSSDFPHGVRTVTVKEWEATCEACGLSSADEKGDRAKAFRRARDALLTWHRIAIFDRLVWVVWDQQ